MAQTSCPKCGSTNITFQREQTGEHWSRNKQSSDREWKRPRMLILGDYRMVVETVIFYPHWMVVESVFRCKEKRT